MISELEAIRYEVGKTTLLGSIIHDKFNRYFMWRCKRRYMRYLGFINYIEMQKERKRKEREMLTKMFK